MSATDARIEPSLGARTSVWAITRVVPEHVALAAVVVLSAILNVIHLDGEGYANTYYAAAVKSMLMSWHNFFFVSFDPAGFVAVDKPPLGLWLQAVSAKLFGFSGVSMLLPQALAGVLSVLVLHLLVSRIFGRPAGVLAALALAVTPIAVVDNRNNTSDSVLILTLLLAAWAVTRAIETGRVRWLVLGATLVGLGFNIKELEAYLILPGLLVMYAMGSPRRPLTRLWHLLVAGVAVLVVSFAWIVAVDLTPPGQRPYVSDSGTNSELSLALGYNGFGRLATGIMSLLPPIPFLHVKLDFTIVPAISAEIANPSALRLFEPAIGGQASWLLPLALIGLVAAVFGARPRLPLHREHVALSFWGTWLLTLGIFFSVARFYHLYYLSILAPAVSALAGIGLVALWKEYRASLANGSARPWNGWLLPFTVVVTGFVQFHVLSGYTGWNDWLRPAVVAATLLIAAVLVIGRLHLQFLLAPDVLFRIDPRAALVATALGVLSLLVAPSAFAATSIANGNGAAWLPQAGPSTGFGAGGFGRPGGSFAGRNPGRFSGAGVPGSGATPGGIAGGIPTNRAGRTGSTTGGFSFRGPRGGGGGALTFAGPNLPTLDPKLLSYLQTHRGGARYLVATPTSGYASLFILKTGQPVLTLGGYQGWDKILTRTQLSALVAQGAIRFFLLSGTGGRNGPGIPGGQARFFGGSSLPAGINTNVDTVNNSLIRWVSTHCTAVPSSAYTTAAKTSSASSAVPGAAGRGFGAQGPGQLYDCATARTG
jgi:4-amino-4-deoxy-L-arabinose transferase-like glycosyltransferase